jgi:MFS family permease
MLRNKLVMKIRMNLNNAFTNVMLVANAFVWYLLVFKFLLDVLSRQNASNLETLMVIGVSTGAIAISALVASIVVDRFKKRSLFLKVWLFLGIFISLIPIGLGVPNMNYLIFSSALLGAYFGVGMPATMGYYSEHIKVENRGKTSGITFLALGLSIAILGSFGIGNVIAACLILCAVKIVGFGTFQFAKENDQEHQKLQKISYPGIIKYRPFILFFVPWCMFSIINYMTAPIVNNLFANQTNYTDFLSPVLESIIIAVSAVTCGFLSDRMGRKRIVIIGFIMLGFGYASLTLFPADYSSYIYVFADGIAWGTFSAIFLLTLWGDIADNKLSDKFYFAGALPYIFSNFMSTLLAPYLSEIAPAAIFSFASVFLFLAVLPLIYAPETLPEKIMKDRDLSSYVSKAIEKVKKETNKEPPIKGENADMDYETVVVEESKETNEDEEARKLAEKYY